MCGAIRCATQAGRRVWPFRSAGRRPGRAGRPFFPWYVLQLVDIQHWFERVYHGPWAGPNGTGSYPGVCRTGSRSVKPGQTTFWSKKRERPGQILGIYTIYTFYTFFTQIESVEFV